MARSENKRQAELSLLKPLRDRWNGILAPRFLKLGTRWRRVVMFIPLQVHPKESVPVPFEKEAGWV